RLTLVGVDAEIDWAGMILREKRPLEPARKPRAAPAAQPGVLDRVNHLRRRHLVERLGQRAITAVGTVSIEARIGLFDDASEKNGFEVGHQLISTVHFACG